MSALSTVEFCKIAGHYAHSRVLRTSNCFNNAEGALVERRGLRQPIPLSVVFGQAMESVGYICVIRPERLFLDRQRPLEQWFSFGRAIERVIEDAEVPQPGGIERVLLAIRSRRHADVLFGDRNRLRDFPSLIEFEAALVNRLQLRRLLLRLGLKNPRPAGHCYAGNQQSACQCPDATKTGYPHAPPLRAPAYRTRLRRTSGAQPQRLARSRTKQS